MMCLKKLAVMLMCVTWSLSGCSDSETTVAKQGYDLRGDDPARGSAYLSDFKGMTNGKMVMSARGQQILQGEYFETDRALKRLEVLEVKDGRMSKVKVEVLLDEVVVGSTIEGEKDTEVEKLPLDGKTLIGTKSDGLWGFKLQDGKRSLDGAGVGGAVGSDKQIKALTEYADIFDIDWFGVGYPDEQVSIGASWNVPLSHITRLFGSSFIISTGTWVETLKDVIIYKERPHGLISGVFNFKGTMIDPDDGTEVIMEMSMQGHHYRDLEHFIDRDADFKGSLRMVTTVVEDGVEVTIEINGSHAITGDLQRLQ